ncbi:hypothetical protein Bca101_044076 [Brassica carinata]
MSRVIKAVKNGVLAIGKELAGKYLSTPKDARFPEEYEHPKIKHHRTMMVSKSQGKSASVELREMIEKHMPRHAPTMAEEVCFPGVKVIL